MSNETLNLPPDLPSEVRVIQSSGDSYFIEVEDAVSNNRLAVTSNELQKIGDLIANTRAETRWIPVSERLPDDDGPYLVTAHWEEEPLDCAFTQELVFDVYTGQWLFLGQPEETQKVIAWQPLPEPYQPDEEP